MTSAHIRKTGRDGCTVKSPACDARIGMHGKDYREGIVPYVTFSLMGANEVAANIASGAASAYLLTPPGTMITGPLTGAPFVSCHRRPLR